MTITFDLEAGDSQAGFFALYAGLRMYMEQKQSRVPEGKISIPAAEAYCMLRDLAEQYPDEYLEAKDEYEAAYNSTQPI